MKHFLLGVCCLVAVSVGALPLSQQARQEAQLFNDFLQAAYAQRMGDPARFELLQRVLTQDPQNSYIKQQLVSEALAIGNLQLAKPYIDFIDNAQDDPEAWAVYGAYAWENKEPARALEAYEKALALDPDDERILFQYISLLAAADPQKAATTLTELAQRNPLFAPEIYTEIGRMYLYHRQFPNALEAFNKASSLDPKDPQPRLGRASVYERNNQYFLMLHELEELEKMGYVTAQTLAQMASVFVLVKDLPRAQTYFERAKELEHDNIPANYFLALFAEQAQDYARAISYLTDSADYAQSPAKQLQVSFYQRKLGQTQESLNTLAQAHARFDQEPEVAYFYAVALYEQEQYKKSARVLASVVEAWPENQEVRLQYAFALEGQKKYRAMEEQLGTLLAQNPRHAGALNLWAYSLALRAQRLDEAADYIAQALAVDPEDYSFLDTQAWVFFKQGKFAQAADVIEAIPDEILAANPEMAYHAVLIYRAAQDPRQAHAQTLACGNTTPKLCEKALQKIR